MSSLSLEPASSSPPPDQQGRRRLPDSFLIRRDQIIPDPDQPRQQFVEKDMTELVASIRSRGIKQPLTVRWNVEHDKYMVIDGGRRFEAATRLSLEELPCWIQQGTPQDVLVDQIVHNWQRVDLQPYETADALVRLRDEHNLTQKELSELTGKPKGEISKLLALRDKVIPEVQQRARAGQGGEAPLTKRHLYNISKVKPAQQEQVTETIVSQNMTAGEAERFVAEVTMKKEPQRDQGISKRRRTFKTTKADVVMVFHSEEFSDEDVCHACDQIKASL